MCTVKGASFDGSNFHSLKHNCESFTAKQAPQGYLVVQIQVLFTGRKSFTANMLGKSLQQSFTQRNLYPPYSIIIKFYACNVTQHEKTGLVYTNIPL